MAKWKYCKKAEFVWNGEWSDATLIYKDVEFSEHIVLDTIWESFNEYAKEKNIEVNEKNFSKYCKNNQFEIEELLELAISN